MKIRFTLTRFDLFKAKTFNLLFSRSSATMLFAVVSLFTVLTFTSSSYSEKSISYKIVLVGVQTVFAFTAGIIAGILFNLFQTLASKGKGIVGEHSLEVTDDGLVETTEYNQSLHRWDAFHKIKSSGGYLWIYVTDTMVHLVPLNRPLLEGDIDLFSSGIRAKMKA